MKHSPLRSALGVFIFTVILLNGSLTNYSQWVQQVSGTDYNLYSVYFINDNTGFIGTSRPLGQPLPLGGEILRTTNGGNNWQRVLYDSTFRVKGFCFLDNNIGFAVGGFALMQGFIFKTTNSGLNWFNITPVSLNTYLWNVIFANNSTGYAGGAFGVVKTTDGGNNWDDRVLTVVNGYPSWGKVSFTNVNTGFFICDSGRVYKTTNAGIDWDLDSISGGELRDIKFTDMNSGFIVGDYVIHKTTNEGLSWSLQNPGISQKLFSVFFTDLNTGYITAERTILKTTNSGNSWFTVFDFPADTLFSSFFVNANTGYTCGDEGRVYKTTTGGVIGINPISGEVPRDFSLYQNYPNPFNPSTNIKFAVPKASFVKLAIYDLLGRELETLVNESLTPGIYEVKWDALRFSTGVYFYKLTTYDFSMVKKMSLIK